MPVQDILEDHHRATNAEATILRLVANGRSDEEIAAELRKTVRAVRATLHRFYERTGLAGRRAVA